MATTNRAILVTGATGLQAAPPPDTCLPAAGPVRALVRDQHSPGAAELARASKRDVSAIAGRTPPDPATAERDFAAMTSSFYGWRADIPALRRLHPAPLDFDDWPASEGKPLLEEQFREADDRCSLSGTERRK